MTKNPISLQDFSSAFQAIVDKPIWRVIHPADGWLTIDLGQKYTDSLPGKDGKDEPYQRGQYQLHITADWEIYVNGELSESRKVNGSSQSDYFSRMDKLVSNFPLIQIDSITLENNTLILKDSEKDSESEIRVPINESSESISLSSVELDTSNKPTFYTHYRFDDELGQLVTITTK